MSLIMLAMEEQADGLAEQLLRDQDAILRYSGCFCLASAYVGTANNKAIRRLLHIAVSDVSNDVRRASVIAIGFVLCNQPERLPKVVSLLAESFNADVRYGSALAIGIACCGSGSKAAVSCLKTLLTDRVDFVRQGSMLALAMVLIGFNAKLEPYVEEFKKALTTTIDSKMNDTMTKFGAILASGIIDAGGRNCTLSLLSSNGQKRIASIVGMLVFTQYWYWYPYIHFVSLSFSPIALIALNKNLNVRTLLHQVLIEIQMPRGFQVKSHAKPSLFAYPPNVETEKKEQTVQTVKAELSISAKAKARAAKRKKDKEGDDAMEVDEKKDTSELKLESQVSETVPEEKVPEEPEFEILTNPARVTVKQREYLTCSSSQRYVPVTRVSFAVIVS
jgi:26S proteasome regulatory subunit N2